MKLKSKVLLVTGGGNGMGREVVLELVRRGASVVAVDLRLEGLQETVRLDERLRGQASLHVADITDAAAVSSCLSLTDHDPTKDDS